MKSKPLSILFSLAMIVIILSSTTADTSAQTGNIWTKLGALPPGAWELASEDASSNNFYAIGNEGIVHTTDGGATWSMCNREARSMRVVSVLTGQNTHAAI